ncbi:GIY-YIG nuclease family protein [Vibrio rotiferianus]|uniref:GIY-YIG nuclease family protein n=1 Tax=Vibrio rotiferianus TaxID=190895 RepID=UPI00390C056C
MNVVVTNNLKAYQVRNAKHVVYIHQNLQGDLYVGQSTCVVNRWNEHMQIATSPKHPEYMQKFKQALRASKYWCHYIVAVGKSQSEADDAEAAAIAYYKPTLNAHAGRSTNKKNTFNFQPLSQGGREIILEGTRIDRYLNQERFQDSERSTILCKAIRKVGKSHISFECIADGFRVNISHSKREGYKAGDLVHISFAAKGKTCYTTTDYSEVTSI